MSGLEKDLDAQVRTLAAVYGFRRYHTYRSKRSPAGFPDLVLVKPPRLIFAELKSDEGRTTADQDEWLADLGRVPAAETYIWRPGDIERIAEILAGRSPPYAVRKFCRTIPVTDRAIQEAEEDFETIMGMKPEEFDHRLSEEMRGLP